MERKLTAIFPHFITAIKNWSEENALSTHIICATHMVEGLPEHVAKRSTGEIGFNISKLATPHFEVNDGNVYFTTRFNGVSTDLIVPLKGIIMIHCPDGGVGVPNHEYDPSGEDEIIIEKPKTKLRLV